MKRRTILSFGLAAAIGLALVPGRVGAQEVNLRYAHVGAEGDIQHWYAERAAERIPEVTDGRVTVTVFPNSQLGGVQASPAGSGAESPGPTAGEGAGAGVRSGSVIGRSLPQGVIAVRPLHVAVVID